MPDIKRVNYFNSQFLVDKDFNDEQAYHLGMRRRLNQLLHSWGVADGGLQVTKTGDKQITVGAGLALDAQGQEIVLLSPQAIDLSAQQPNSDVFVTIQYREVQDPADHYTTGGVDNYTRWTERPNIQTSTSTPASDGSTIPLAKVHLDANGNVANIDMTIRTLASSVISPAASLTVGSLSVSGSAGIGGSLGVGMAAAPSGQMLDIASNAGNTGNSALRALFPSGGALAAAEFGALAHRNGQWQALYARGGTGGAIALYTDGEVNMMNGNVGIGNATPTFMLHVGTGTRGLRIEGGTGATSLSLGGNGDLSVDSPGVPGGRFIVKDGGNVGIGTATPKYRLDVRAASIKLGLEDNGGGQLLIVNNPNDNRIYLEAFNTAGNGSAAEFLLTGASATAVPQITLVATTTMVGGNLGVGVAPGFRLDVADRMRVRQGGAGTAGIWFFETAPNQDRAFVGMASDNSVGFWGNTGAGWGLQMDTSSGRVTMSNGLFVSGQTVVAGPLLVQGPITATGGKGGYVMDRFMNNLGDAVEVGDVLVLSGDQPSHHYGIDEAIPVPEVDLGSQTYDTHVCGVVCELYGEAVTAEGEVNQPARGRKQGRAKSKSGENASVQPRAFTAEEMAQKDRTRVESGQIGYMVTLGAFAHCKVDADIASIEVGDLLTTSPTKGHAQKVLDMQRATGAILGKALGSLKNGKGTIPIMVLLH